MWDILIVYGSDGGIADQAAQDHQIFNGQGQSDQNAFYHTIVSAGIAFYNGVASAHFYGQMREFRTLLSPNETFSYPDAARDIFNNEVGIRIVQYAIQNGLPEAALLDLALDALSGGLLIADEYEDSRLDISSFPVIRDDEIYDDPSSGVAAQIENEYGLPHSSLPKGDASGEGVPVDWPVLDPESSPRPEPRPDDGLLHDEAFERQLEGKVDGGGGKGSKNDLSDEAAFKKPSITPLVIDLDGDGVELISLENSTAFFDLDVDGFAQNTGWVSADDTLLALDVDGDGIIDDGSELFGDQTGFGNGFLALADHDSNSDGVIDANDAIFSDLVVWQDLNGDGFSAESEMFSLTDVGITSINLGYTNITETNQGHYVLQRSSVTFADGSVHDIDDVYFENDPRASVALLPDGFEYHSDAFKLPALFGYGHIASTWVALSLDSDLRTDASALVTQVSNGDIVGFEAAFEEFLFAWTGVVGVDPDSRGPAVNAQKLAFLEEAYGEGFDMSDGVYGTNPGPVAGLEIDAQFDELASKLAARFIAQSAISEALQTATSQSEFDMILADHPFAALTELVSGYSRAEEHEERDDRPRLCEGWRRALVLSRGHALERSDTELRGKPPANVRELHALASDLPDWQPDMRQRRSLPSARRSFSLLERSRFQYVQGLGSTVLQSVVATDLLPEYPR